MPRSPLPPGWQGPQQQGPPSAFPKERGPGSRTSGPLLLPQDTRRALPQHLPPKPPMDKGPREQGHRITTGHVVSNNRSASQFRRPGVRAPGGTELAAGGGSAGEPAPGPPSFRGCWRLLSASTSYRGICHWMEGPPQIQYDFVLRFLTDYVFKDPISK